MSTPKSSDSVFEKALDAKLELLRECQAKESSSVEFNGNSYGSCFPCLKIIGCETRKAYVLSAYNSMSKGDTGGFEF